MQKISNTISIACNRNCKHSLWFTTMTAYVFDGKKFAKDKETLLLNKVKQLRKHGITPKLAAILVGDDPASKIYVSIKQKTAERIGIALQLIELKQSTAQRLLHLIKELNVDDAVHGIMVQLPLPGELNKSHAKDLILNTIALEKDVDGLRQDNSSHASDKLVYMPAVVKAILYSIEVAQKLGFAPRNLKKAKICVVGASGVVGKRLVGVMGELGGTVVKTDVKTKDLSSKTQKAEILISATGVSGLIKGNMVKPGSVVIDVGAPNGDVDFESVSKVSSFITPVPGGIGPVTVVSLIGNVVEAAEKANLE